MTKIDTEIDTEIKVEDALEVMVGALIEGGSTSVLLSRLGCTDINLWVENAKIQDTSLSNTDN